MDVDSQYITRVSTYLNGFNSKGSVYNFRCPICGDSKKDKTKARGYLYSKEDSWFYRCFNCDAGMTFSSFLFNVSPELHREYRAEHFKKGKERNKLFDALHKRQEQQEIENKKIEKSIDISLLRELMIPILKLPESHISRQYVSDRLIPEHRHRELYFTDDINELKMVFDGYDDVTFKKEPRLILPVINRENKIVGLITRSLAKNPKLRYVNLKVSDETPLLFNLHAIDENKPIIVVEGAIDSLFLDNCVSASNLHLKGLTRYFKKDNLTLVFDNEPRHKQVIKALQNAIDEGFNVVIWPKNIIQKDVNEMVMSGISDVQTIINTNTFKGMQAILEFQEWRKLF